MSFLEHLDELRRRILYSLYALVACCAVTFYFWTATLSRIYVSTSAPNGGKLIFTQPMAGFMFSLKISALAGLIAASPFIFSQLWLFVAPGLYAREKKVVDPVRVLLVAAVLRAARTSRTSSRSRRCGGSSRAIEMDGVEFMPTLDTTFSFYVKVVARAGADLPDADAGVLPGALRHGHRAASVRKFKYAVLIIVVVAAIITPSGDPVNLRCLRRRCWCCTSSASASPGCSARRSRKTASTSYDETHAYEAIPAAAWWSVALGGRRRGCSARSAGRDAGSR